MKKQTPYPFDPFAELPADLKPFFKVDWSTLRSKPGPIKAEKLSGPILSGKLVHAVKSKFTRRAAI
jgi:hypothetical protein